jgi:hypothetical protein
MNGVLIFFFTFATGLLNDIRKKLGLMFHQESLIF